MSPTWRGLLGAVLKRRVGDALLDTYGSER